MMDQPSAAGQDGELITIEYGGRTYRFVEPEMPQDPIYYVRKTGSFYEREMLEDMRCRLKNGDLVIDVGANFGNMHSSSPVFVNVMLLLLGFIRKHVIF